MDSKIALTKPVVKKYVEAIDFYVNCLNFDLVEDIVLKNHGKVAVFEDLYTNLRDLIELKTQQI